MSIFNFCRKAVLLCFIGIASIPAQAQEEAVYASEVISYGPGFVLGGEPFDPRRTDPNQSLGKPENVDEFDFVSLGFGGELILSFDRPVKNGDGVDIRVVETSFGQEGRPCEAWPEKIEVFVSQDGGSWTSAGIGCRTSEFAIPDELPWIKYLRLKDISDPAHFTDGNEGYDVDGVEALHGYFSFKPVLPTLTCVQPAGGNKFKAHLGYNNQNETTEYIPVGSRNYFSPGPTDVGQTENFLPGVHESAFTLDFEDGDVFKWRIKGSDSTENWVSICSDKPLCPAEMPAAVLSGGGIICNELETAQISVALSGEAPWSITYKDADGVETTETNITESPYVFETNQLTTFTLVSVSNAHGSGVVSGSASVFLAPTPTASFGGGGVICEGEKAQFFLELTGTAPWKAVYENEAGQQFILEDINTSSYSFYVEEASVYTLVSAQDATCPAEITGIAIVKFLEKPGAVLSAGDDPVLCGDTDVAELELTLTGKAPFQVVYTDGTDNYTLKDIAETGLTIEVNKAGIYELVSVQDANCEGDVSGQVEIKSTPAAAPVIEVDEEVVCLNSLPFTLTGKPSGGEFSGAGVTGDSFDPEAAGPGVHAISYVYENEDGCTAQATKNITVISPPTALLSGGGKVCAGGEVELSLELTGTAPWTVVYQNEQGVQFALENINTPEYSFKVNEASVYSLVSVEDATCSGEISGTAIVENLPKPAASISAGDDPAICNDGDVAEINLTLTGEAPFQIVYTNGAENFTLTNVTETFITVEAHDAGVYELVSVQDANCQGDVSGQAIIELAPAPAVTIQVDNDIVCLNSLPVALTGQPSGGVFSGPGVSGASFDPAAAGSGLHPIIYLYENAYGCTATAEKTITVRELPTAELSGGDILCDVNDPVYLQVKLTGESPWDIIYTDGEQEFELKGLSTANFDIEATKGGEYRLIAVSDAYCEGAVSGSATVDELTEPLSIDFTIPAESCVDEIVPLEVGFSGQGLTWKWSTSGMGMLADPTAQVTDYIPAEGETGEVDFKLELKNACASLEETFTLTINEPVNAEFTTSGDLETLTDIKFIPENPNGELYSWSFGDGEESMQNSPEHLYREPGDYTVSLIVEEDGCEAASEKTLSIIEEKILYIPNVFSPSASDVENRVVKLYGKGISPDGFLFRIVNRWNNVLFETLDLNVAKNQGWDGRSKNNGEMQAQGVYTYVIKGEFLDGETFEGTGTVTLLR